MGELGTATPDSIQQVRLQVRWFSLSKIEDLQVYFSVIGINIDKSVRYLLEQHTEDICALCHSCFIGILGIKVEGKSVRERLQFRHSGRLDHCHNFVLVECVIFLKVKPFHVVQQKDIKEVVNGRYTR